MFKEPPPTLMGKGKRFLSSPAIEESRAYSTSCSETSFSSPNEEHRYHHTAVAKRRRRTQEDFLNFCQIVLAYENYDPLREQDTFRQRHSSSPLGSTGSTGSSHDSIQSKEDLFNLHDVNKSSEEDEDDDMHEDEGWEDITCYCKKPFAGRPMIECSLCLTWVHLKCAKISGKRIPDIWYCSPCRQTAGSVNGRPSKGGRSVKMKRHVSSRVKKSFAKAGPVLPKSPNPVL